MRFEEHLDERFSPECLTMWNSLHKEYYKKAACAILRFKDGLSPFKKKLFASVIALQKWWKIPYFILKALFILKIFKSLS